ncbi:hypothetical protein BN8_03093 [Fibrisoma limi BUZ 3]|uniref:Uncharacterized protein n=1 Tax=Fibrisoma limi BUZ 3 TaxID=1185876 RepID=I2GJ82_9BACT|nr:hypothetical protein [Fibrisoma limi]CCH53957.1 hypothetical protein BN8_03093 [Fibrisoma limi BUZ 3]
MNKQIVFFPNEDADGGSPADNNSAADSGVTTGSGLSELDDTGTSGLSDEGGTTGDGAPGEAGFAEEDSNRGQLGNESMRTAP